MSDTRELRPLSWSQASHTPTAPRALGGPLRVTHEAFVGTTDYLCPSCKVVLVEQSNARGVATIKRLDCYKCGQPATGSGADVLAETD
ncbi:MAG TPA: hypothetical protein VGQ44_05790 [Gemmatimonadaceae bacterium]|jgi:hypothetical protein|nr:hypothetical protein [Gemmatimonadaceae bacterium]